MSRSTTGDSTPYSTASEEALTKLLAAALDGSNGGRLEVTADIQWAGTYNAKAHRTTVLDGLNLDQVQQAVAAAKEAGAVRDSAEPYKSYKAKGWHAQLHELTRTDRGSEAADRAGLNPSSRTLMRWLSTAGEPSKANRDRISAAYSELRNKPVTDAQQAYERANHAVAEALNASARDRYGAEVRFHGPTNISAR